MSAKISAVIPFDDYAQSANTLFHFMNKSEYLNSILLSRAIVPRYCVEDIEYLNICVGDVRFKEIAVLQKCFCDIPLHKLADSFELCGVGEAYDSLTDGEKFRLMKNNSHPDFYGEFAVAFSKNWSENKNLQPIHYLNEKSQYMGGFINLCNSALNSENLNEDYAIDIISRLSYIKPLRGIMERHFKSDSSKDVTVKLYKNFHDEQEWRYVPNTTALSGIKLEQIIANPNMLNLREYVSGINSSLTTEKYRSLWLEYEYDDIRYIIVPDSHSRIDVINTIMKIPENKFDDPSHAIIQKYILVSKILVLDEIRKDW